jgi:hypothetical protein
MIEFVGSEYRYRGEKLSSPEIIFIRDHHFNEELQEFAVKKLLENSVCDPLDHTLMFDHVLQHEDILKSYKCIFLPSFLAGTTSDFLKQKIIIDWNNKITCFNFMINKPRLHREFLLQLIDYFSISNYKYTLCWKKNEINRQHMYELTLSELYKKIILETKISIVPKQFLLGQENLLDQGLQNNHIKNSENYQAFLQKEVFEPTCISLITEPAFFERETIITEKTIMAIYGGTIPVWVGGWRIADYMRDQGFDVFDDIVDHSYQDMPDPWDRCYYAIERNVNLLKDFDTVQKFVYDNKHRLQANLDLLETNTFVNICHKKIEDISDDLVRNTVRNKFSWLTHN